MHKLDERKVTLLDKDSTLNQVIVTVPDIDAPVESNTKIKIQVSKPDYHRAIQKIDEKIAQDVDEFVHIYHGYEDSPDIIVLIGMPCLWGGIEKALSNRALTSKKHSAIADDMRVFRITNREGVATGAFVSSVFNTVISDKEAIDVDSDTDDIVTSTETIVDEKFEEIEDGINISHLILAIFLSQSRVSLQLTLPNTLISGLIGAVIAFNLILPL